MSHVSFDLDILHWLTGWNALVHMVFEHTEHILQAFVAATNEGREVSDELCLPAF